MNDIITPFNYSDLPTPVAAELQAVTNRIKERLTRQVADIIATGRDLLEVKSALEHGQFEAWLNSEFGMAVRTAQRFMRASEWAQDKNDTVSYLTPTTIYMISAKSTPEGVHEQVVERLEKGLPAEPEYILHVIQDAKIREREAKNRKGKREARKARPLPTAENKKRDQDQQLDVDVDAVSEAGAHAYKKQTAYGAGSDAIGGFEGLCRAWNACSEDEQGRFLIHISWDVVEELRKERDDLKRALDKQKAKTKDAKATVSDVLDQLKPRRGELAEARDKQEPLHAEIKRLSTDRQTSDDDPFGLKDMPDFLHRTSGKTKPAQRPRSVWKTTPAMKVAADRDREKCDEIAGRPAVLQAVESGADTFGKIRKVTTLADPLIKSALRFHVKERAVLKNGNRYSTIGSESRS